METIRLTPQELEDELLVLHRGWRVESEQVEDRIIVRYYAPGESDCIKREMAAFGIGFSCMSMPMKYPAERSQYLLKLAHAVELTDEFTVFEVRRFCGLYRVYAEAGSKVVGTVYDANLNRALARLYFQWKRGLKVELVVPDGEAE